MPAGRNRIWQPRTRLKGNPEWVRKLNEPWAHFMQGVQLRLAVTPSWTVAGVRKWNWPRLCGSSIREISAKFGITPTAARTMRRVLEQHLEFVEKGGQPLEELFSRYGTFAAAWDRARSSLIDHEAQGWQRGRRGAPP